MALAQMSELQVREQQLLKQELLEQGGDGAVLEDFVDGLGHQRGDGEHREVFPALGVLRQGIRGDDLARTTGAQALTGRSGEHTVGGGDDHVTGASFAQHAHSTGNGSAGIDHVVQQHTGATLDIANHAVSGDLVGHIDIAGLVDERQRGIAQHVCPLLGYLDSTGIRGDHADVVQVVVLLDVIREDRHGVHVINWAVEEALDLIGVQVHGDDAIRTSGLQQVSDQASGDGLASAVLLVLACIGVERQDCGDALGGSALERINHDELFHEPVVQWQWVGLEHEGIGAADGFIEADEDLTVGEISGGGGGQFNSQLASHSFTQFWMSATTKEHQVFLIVDPIGGGQVSALPDFAMNTS